jgi:hypothetical protein
MDQHRLEKLVVFRPEKWESPRGMLAKVRLEDFVRSHLDGAHVAAIFLHADEIVNVDVGVFDALDNLLDRSTL